MTSRSYRDISVNSPQGAYKFEAVSAENGTIQGRGGQLTENHFGVMQRNFRYRLCAANGSVIWERWQEKEEASPVRLWVSESGAAVARAHFASWNSEDLLFFGGDGELKLTVRIASANPGFEEEEEEEEVSLGELEYWVDEEVGATSIGPKWTPGSLAFFVEGDKRFVVHTRWGRRLVVDRHEWKDDQADALDSGLELAERAASALILDRFIQGQAFPTDYDSLQDLQGALVLAWRHNMVEAEPFLARLERAWKNSGSYSSSHVLQDGWYVRQDSLLKLGNCLSWKVRNRALAADACLIGRPRYEAHKEPSVEAEDDGQENDEQPDWETIAAGPRGSSESLAEMSSKTVPAELLLGHGYPDHVKTLFDKSRRSWSESWDYDFADCTFRIVWPYPEEPLGGRAGIVSVQRIEPPLWTSWERILSAWR